MGTENTDGLTYLAHEFTHADYRIMCSHVSHSQYLAAKLINRGYTVINPLATSIGIEVLVEEDRWIQHGLTLLSGCQRLILAPMWRYSKGCLKEHALAVSLGLDIYEIRCVGTGDGIELVEVQS